VDARLREVGVDLRDGHPDRGAFAEEGFCKNALRFRLAAELAIASPGEWQLRRARRIVTSDSGAYSAK
jgi:hypothetical protein